VVVKKVKRGLTKAPFHAIIKVQKEKELTTMAKKKKELDRRVFKKEGEDLQQYLAFRRRGSKVESGKKYNRQKFKKGE
jgi:hypothetical protein